MIVCHCNLIDHTEIERTTAELKASDRLTIVTPVMVYKALGKRPRCGGCLPLATSIMHSGALSSARCDDCPMAVRACDTLFEEPPRPFVEAAE